MPVYVDSCVVLDIMTDDELFGDWSENILSEYRQEGLWVNWMVYAEICAGLDHPSEADQVLQELGLELKPSSRNGLWLAAKAFVRYRAAGGVKASPLPDFLIGAQAEAEELKLITRDSKRFQTYFPNVRLILPHRGRN
ncbi:MAG: PIN domain-containing protein [Verrucomicrobia bacterium]|nr:PIN domain-containing protein [Verrucomicrobiota bacterium]MCH8514212.1 PIN domain-containing protein [Kiritimatiellia bacterium]